MKTYYFEVFEDNLNILTSKDSVNHDSDTSSSSSEIIPQKR